MEEQQKPHDGQDIRLFIAVPSGGEWKANTGMCIAFLCANLCFPMHKRHTWHLENVKSSNISKGRERLVEKARQMESTHMLFIDSDMTFTPDVARELLQHDLPIIALNCPTRFFPVYPTARLNNDTRNGELIYVNPKSGGLRKVWKIGTGIMLINMKVFDTIPQPWFPTTWNAEAKDYDGEDWSFITKAALHGFDAYVDMGLSRHVGHVGDYTYTHADVEPVEQRQIITGGRK